MSFSSDFCTLSLELKRSHLLVTPFAKTSVLSWKSLTLQPLVKGKKMLELTNKNNKNMIESQNRNELSRPSSVSPRILASSSSALPASLSNLGWLGSNQMEPIKSCGSSWPFLPREHKTCLNLGVSHEQKKNRLLFDFWWVADTP